MTLFQAKILPPRIKTSDPTWPFVTAISGFRVIVALVETRIADLVDSYLPDKAQWSAHAVLVGI